MYDIPSHNSSTNQLLDADAITTESSYVCPTKTVGRFTTDDYEEAPPEYDNYSNYVQPDLLDNVQYEVADYPLPTSNSTDSSALPVGEPTLPEDEQIYEDPGHIKEEIYEWFKQRNICMLDKNSVR